MSDVVGAAAVIVCAAAVCVEPTPVVKIIDKVVVAGDPVLVAVVVTEMYRGSYMSAHVLLNLLKELEKRDKM